MDKLRSWWKQILFLSKHDKIGNPKEFGDLWVWSWKMVCFITIVGLMVALIYGVVFGVLQSM